MMISQILSDARRLEAERGARITESERPGFHLSSYTGWMNDPNGFTYYNGQYHMFYQYHPYKSQWGPMHWGHAVSRDLLHWEYLPAALAPDRYYDEDGCFSGSALPLPDGRLLLMYTGVRKELQPDGRMREVQVQCMAAGDGTDFEKYPGNPVLSENDLPAGASRFDFRDPKMFIGSDGVYRCVIGSRPADTSGQILLYKSRDGLHWQFEKILAENRNRFGKMWECPDFFSLDGKQVLLTSPQDMLSQGFEYHAGNGTLCLIGSYDEANEEFTEETIHSIDYGIDFYAPQTVLMPDGRRVMIGWMQNWDACEIREPDSPWAGQMSLPRELFLRNGRLCQRPILELAKLRSGRVEYHDVAVSGRLELPGVDGRMVDMEIRVRPKDPGKLYSKFAVHFAENEQFYTSFRYRPYEGTVKLDRNFSGSRRAILHHRRCFVGNDRAELRFRMILDQYSVEVFIDDGEKVMTATMYTDRAADGISFYTEGEAVMDIVKYDLRP